MDAIRKVIRKIRNQHIDKPKPETPVEKFVKDIKIASRKKERWEADKVVVRDNHFRLAQIALEERRAEQRMERERQDEITRNRLKNLKKARRKLKRIRNEKEG